MDETTYSNETENIYDDLDDFFVKPDYFCSHTTVDSISNHSNETEIPSDPWFDEKDILTLPTNKESTEVERKIAGSNKCGTDWKSTPLVLKESQLKAQEIELLNELALAEAEQKKSNENAEVECEKLHKEIEKMQKQISKKNEQISELNTQNMNLKKNICSLYKTAKGEIERKDALLRETNRRLDTTLYWYNSLKLAKDKKDAASSSAVYENASKEPNSSSNHKDQHTKSRKRDLNSLETSTEQRDKHQSYENNCLSQSQLSCSKSYNSYTMCKPLQSDKSTKIVSHQSKAKETDNGGGQIPPIHRDLTKTDAIFFKLLPDALRKSFQDYEQTQVVTLNRLKQAFVNHYFSNVTSDAHASRPFFFTGTVNESNQRTFNRSKSESQLYAGSQTMHNTGTDSSTFIHVRREPNGKDLKSTKTDILNLYMYRQEKIPFLVKRRYGLLKQS